LSLRSLKKNFNIRRPSVEWGYRVEREDISPRRATGESNNEESDDELRDWQSWEKVAR